MFQDLTVGSANKQRHRVMMWPAPGCTACHHDHSEEQIPVQTTVSYQSSCFQSSPQHTSFLLMSKQSLLHGPRNIPTEDLTCSGTQGTCSLSKFSIVKSKPNSCNNSFSWTVLLTAEVLQLFSNLILKSPCCSLCLFLQFSSLSLPPVRNTTEQASIQNNMQIKCTMSYTVNMVTNTSRNSESGQPARALYALNT